MFIVKHIGGTVLMIQNDQEIIKHAIIPQRVEMGFDSEDSKKKVLRRYELATIQNEWPVTWEVIGVQDICGGIRVACITEIIAN